MSGKQVLVVASAMLHVLAAVSVGSSQRPVVQALVETEPVPSAGDAADDMAVWVHQSNPARSRLIGADKESGLVVYDLDGNQLQYMPDGSLNTVDIRYGFPLGGAEVALVTSGERSTNLLAL